MLKPILFSPTAIYSVKIPRVTELIIYLILYFHYEVKFVHWSMSTIRLLLCHLIGQCPQPHFYYVSCHLIGQCPQPHFYSVSCHLISQCLSPQSYSFLSRIGLSLSSEATLSFSCHVTLILFLLQVLVWHTRTEKADLRNEDKFKKRGFPGSNPDIEV